LDVHPSNGSEFNIKISRLIVVSTGAVIHPVLLVELLRIAVGVCNYFGFKEIKDSCSRSEKVTWKSLYNLCIIEVQLHG
jgi:hypothetical protein